MTPSFAPAQLAKCKPWEYLVRFAFGGVVTVGTGLIAKVWGPMVAGLFLAFPAILPASLTLVKQHDGRAKAVDDARGGRLGSLGLIGFAVVVALAATELHPLLVLVLASIAWLTIDVSAWFVRYSRAG